MINIKKGQTAHQRHKKVLKLARGYRNRNRTSYRVAVLKVRKAASHRYVSYKLKKRNFRSLFIKSINAAVREYNLNYSTFIYKLNKLDIYLNRKMLSELAINEPLSFRALVNLVKN